MKSRIDENGYFLGVYTDAFLSANTNEIINGVLVSEWILTYILPNELFLKGRLVDGVFIETATESELNEYYGTV